MEELGSPKLRFVCDWHSRGEWTSNKIALVFRPSATVSRIGLMESCTCHHGGPPSID